MTNSEARKRAQAEVDDWCRSESCRYRDWRSGSVPTHRLGADCPTPAAASQVQGAAEVGADEVERLARALCDADPTSTPTTWDHVREEHRNYRRQHAAALLAAGWVPAERVAEARAEAWDEAAEATSEWMWNNPGPSGIHSDPPRNPYETRALDGDQGGGLLDEDGGA